jgi:hypothetical protein
MAIPYAFVCVVFTANCSSPMNASPTVEGVIAQVTHDPLMILVQHASQQCGYWFLVDADTEIRVSTSTVATGAGDSDELRVGVRVSAWADGDMVMTCPASGRAERVIVGR